MKFTHASLFSGIGGFDLAAQWMGWDNLFHCEWNEFCQKVLKYYFPKSTPHHDITKTDFTIYRNRVDILTGGFPCQPFSVAGNQLGTEDERHLWPEMLRAIREIQPPFVVGENVPGLINWNGGLVFEQVQADLEAEGYQVTPVILPACSTGAPHRRDRIWFIAFNPKCSTHGKYHRGKSSSQGLGLERDFMVSEGRIESPDFFKSSNDNVANTEGERAGRLRNSIGEERSPSCNELPRVEPGVSNWSSWPNESPFCDGNDGVSFGLDGIAFSKWRNESIKAGGNAIVPQVALQIFKAIEQYDRKTTNPQA